MGPHRPENAEFGIHSAERLPRHTWENWSIWCKILKEISEKWETNLAIDIAYDEIIFVLKKYVSVFIQYEIWHDRVATNTKLHRMNILECEDC